MLSEGWPNDKNEIRMKGGWRNHGPFTLWMRELETLRKKADGLMLDPGSPDLTG